MGYTFEKVKFERDIHGFITFLSSYEKTAFGKVKPELIRDLKWVCMNELKEYYDYSKLDQYLEIIRYKATINSFTFILSYSKLENKFNFEVIYADNPDNIYQIPCILDSEVNQTALKILYNDIINNHKQKMEKLSDFVNAYAKID